MGNGHRTEELKAVNCEGRLSLSLEPLVVNARNFESGFKRFSRIGVKIANEK
jgi:hypothetical protein